MLKDNIEIARLMIGAGTIDKIVTDEAASKAFIAECPKAVRGTITTTMSLRRKHLLGKSGLPRKKFAAEIWKRQEELMAQPFKQRVSLCR